MQTLFILFLLVSFPLFAQRDPVLKQIDVPHPYYYREMYLPQLTSGPSSVTWSPDSKSLIYSMQGSLWQQSLGSTTARQLTAGPGYDYQPDWSPNGRSVVFSRYVEDAVELYLLDPQTLESRRLTNEGAVNVEPRWSPDGTRIAFVSTRHNKRFHLFIGTIQDGQLSKMMQLMEERESKIPRYYYSSFDHEISPTWSPDGSEIVFISNHERAYGTGGFWRMKAEKGAEPREIHYEETTWKARPDWSPDGKRIIYSSYLGRQWHQLWIMTEAGGDVFPLTYGEFDVTSARWSPDGKKIAYISNKNGDTSLVIQEAVGGKQMEVKIAERRYLKPMGILALTVLDANDNPTAARVAITGSDGRIHAPDNAWIHADDSFVRAERDFEPQYFHTSGKSEIRLPAGKAVIDVMKGFKHRLERVEVNVEAEKQGSVTVRLKALQNLDPWKDWISGDLHVHLNYGGTYRNDPSRMIFQASAEDVNVVHNLVVNKEQRIPDISYFSGKPDPASTNQTLLLHDQEFHTSYWGHTGLLNLKTNYLLPDYSSYYNTAAASPYPTNSVVADQAHEQGALFGYVHPFVTVPDPEKETLSHELPVDVALGKVDYLEVVGFSDHHATAEVWYRLLNNGFRITAGAGTDAMANYTSLRGPVGLNRVFAYVPGTPDRDRWTAALKAGRTFATNGPLLHFIVQENQPGGEIELPAGKHELEFRVSMRSIVPVDHLEIVWNGKVIKTLNPSTGDGTGNLPVSESGWLALRAWNEKSAYPIFDAYPYATTSPIYVTVGGKPVRSKADAQYFVNWIDRVIESATKHEGYNTADEKEAVLNYLKRARQVFVERSS